MNDRLITFGGRVLPVFEIEIEDEANWLDVRLDRFGDRAVPKRDGFRWNQLAELAMQS